MRNFSDSELAEILDKDIFHKISQAADNLGMECYVVGGFVRDIFLERPSNDIDVVVVGSGIAVAQELKKILGKRAHVAVYKNFGTAQVKYGDTEVEFVGARKESYQRDSRKPIVEDGTLEDDQNRRDFTINALAICLNKDRFGELVDPFDGLYDMEDGIIRTPLDPDITFSDDPLRMLRCIRFATQLNFYIDDETFEALERNRERIKIISGERIAEELNKILKSPVPSKGFVDLQRCGLLELILPELSALDSVEVRNGRAHKNNFYHTLEVLDNVARRTRTESPLPSSPSRGRTENADSSESGMDRKYYTADPLLYEKLKSFAKENRTYATPAESCLWEHIKSDRLGVNFRRQHIIKDYIVDFVCLEKQLVIEVDGAYHSEPRQAEDDKIRTASLEKLGFRVIRFTNDEVIGNTDEVIANIKTALTSCSASSCTTSLTEDSASNHQVYTKPPLEGEVGGGSDSGMEPLWLRWAALLHDIGKPKSKRWEVPQGWTFNNHNLIGARMIPNLFRRLKLPLDMKMKYVQKLVDLHMRPIIIADEIVTDSAVRRLMNDAGDDLDDLLILCEADITSKNQQRKAQFLDNYRLVREKLKDLAERDYKRLLQPVIDGNEIMEMFNLKPSREVGALKQCLKDAVLDNKVENEREPLMALLMQKAKEMGLK